MPIDLLIQFPKWKARLAEIESELSQPTAYANPQKAAELAREHTRVKRIIELAGHLEKARADVLESEILVAENTDRELAEMAKAELPALAERESKLTAELQIALIPPDPNDSRNTIVEIRAGAGGQESALFAAELLRMYSHFAEAQGWTVEPIDSSPSDLGGFKEVVVAINGKDVFKKLRHESGVHRVQRVPATEASGRIHTSTVTVAVLPEAEEVDIEIKPEELRIEVCRASGPGGQGVNTTDSAVQILHIPTGLIVKCQDCRSQIKNKASALRVLRTRLLERKQQEEAEKYAAQRRGQIGTGERNEKIRTYNFPQNRVTDHRINLTLHDLPTILDGHIDGLVEPLVAKALEERLAQVA